MELALRTNTRASDHAEITEVSPDINTVVAWGKQLL